MLLGQRDEGCRYFGVAVRGGLLSVSTLDDDEIEDLPDAVQDYATAAFRMKGHVYQVPDLLRCSGQSGQARPLINSSPGEKRADGVKALEQLQLDRLVEQLEVHSGRAALSTGELSLGQVDVLRQVFGDDGYQSYLQDQVNRQIIRDFTINAVMLGFLPEQGVTGISAQVATREGRAALSLHMLMSSVEQAAELMGPQESEPLQKLKPGLKLPPYIKLIQGRKKNGNKKRLND